MDDINEKLIKQKIAQDPRYKYIFSNLWLLAEELSWRGTLQEVVDCLRIWQEKELAEIRAVWEKANGRPMNQDEEKLCFENTEIKTSLVTIEKTLEFIEYMYKANQTAQLLGLNGAAPIVISQQIDGRSRGGRQKALEDKERVAALKIAVLRDIETKKVRNPYMSMHAIHKKVAEQHGISASRVYQIYNSQK